MVVSSLVLHRSRILLQVREPDSQRRDKPRSALRRRTETLSCRTTNASAERRVGTRGVDTARAQNPLGVLGTWDPLGPTS